MDDDHREGSGRRASLRDPPDGHARDRGDPRGRPLAGAAVAMGELGALRIARDVHAHRVDGQLGRELPDQRVQERHVVDARQLRGGAAAPGRPLAADTVRVHGDEAGLVRARVRGDAGPEAVPRVAGPVKNDEQGATVARRDPVGHAQVVRAVVEAGVHPMAHLPLALLLGEVDRRGRGRIRAGGPTEEGCERQHAPGRRRDPRVSPSAPPPDLRRHCVLVAPSTQRVEAVLPARTSTRSPSREDLAARRAAPDLGGRPTRIPDRASDDAFAHLVRRQSGDDK